VAKRGKGIYRRGSVYWICYVGLDGKTVRESSGSTKYDDAVKKLDERRAAIRDGNEPEIKKIKNHAFSGLAGEYRAWISGRQSSARVKGYIIGQLIQAFGNLPLRRFNTVLIEQLQTDMINKGMKAASNNKVLNVLKHMFSKAVEWEMVETDVLKKIRKVRMLQESRRLRYLSQDECRALLSACDPHLKPIIATALNTGMRKGEILSLKWDNVDLKHGFILLDKTKNGERREIPINSTLRSALQGLRKRIDIPYVFCDPVTGKPYRDVKRSFGTALKKVEIQKCLDCDYQKPRVKTKEDAETCPKCCVRMAVLKGIQDFHFHDLRHTFASHLVMAGVDLTTVSRLLGHKDIKMTLRYSHLAPAHMVNAVNILDKKFNEGQTSHLLHSEAVFVNAEKL
jgi:integrase